ncbi:MAG: hypothetical protein LQ345_005183 [Seirophora villosa]|nr:MAG: hypothetical protein LQ345_005183 [Seirophora villosa]
MTRLWILAACFAHAFATMDYNMAGSTKEADMGQKNTMQMSSGYGEAMMKNDANQKNAEDMGLGSGQAAANISVAPISSCKGGNAPVEQIAQPPMPKGMMHKITVGGEAGLVFSPSSLIAAPGDMVEFTFMSQNHTVTQSTFPKPCLKMQGGADSGFLPNPNNTISPPPSYIFQVKDTKPAWFYCKQKKPTSHCGKGMTFSINPTADKSHEMFMQMAIQQNGTAGATAMSGSMTSMAATSTVIAPSPPPETSSASPPPAAAPPPAAPPAAAPPAVPPRPIAGMASPPTPQNLAAEPAAPPATAPGNSMVLGAGSMNNGQCSCSCLCGTAAFPAGAGIGMYGGWSGAVAM